MVSGELTGKQNKIADVLDVANNLVRFPLKESDLSSWSKQLDRMFPDLEIRKLQFLIDQFAEDDIIEWDPNKGIQNVVKGLHRIHVNAKGAYCINPIA